jgi:hypothetical protein
MVKMLEFAAFAEKRATINQLAAGLSRADLHQLVDEFADEMQSIMDGANDEDILFVPLDPAANDRWAADPAEVSMPWTFGHVIVHCNASAEEAAALSTAMARGAPVKERSRYEVPWREVRSVAQLHALLEESRRIQHAYLDVWPQTPHLELKQVPWPGAEEIDAIGRFILGLAHSFAHLDQLREIMRQARTARGVI